ncbi:hypothetical protein PYW07_004816 [Mythimna separata]|uniref:E3 ubiquitin-protein ligase n=1 Tax=Mythimna separata TaxID=271217 RepID=A0AAD8DZB8_MYTSE|nr:hypothetical protein PYW07_004816 [Mythimna separata]
MDAIFCCQGSKDEEEYLNTSCHFNGRRSLFYEILAGVWVRNGLQIKGQAMTYIQANFCNSMVDMDIYWLQVCAAHLPADQFLDMCIDMFGCREWLSMMPMSPAQAAEQDTMVEGLLTFLAILVSSRTNLGNDELTQSRLEVSTLLAAGDKTHSQLLELMPERSGNAHTRNFETVLKELSTYRPPPKGSENLEQGLFVPKPIVWEQYYDPLHVLRRAVHRRDFHASMERFTTYVRDKQKAAGAADGPSRTAGGVLWPPLRAATPPPPGAGDPRALCASGVLHGALLGVLHRGVHRRTPDSPAPHAPPDHVLALATYLLHVAADLHAERQQQHHRDAMVAAGGVGRGVVSGVPLLGAFAGAAVCDNARTVVASVPKRKPAKPTHSFPAHYTHHHHSDSDTEWEPSENETTRIPLLTTSTSLPATSTALAVPTSLQLNVMHQVARGDSMTDDQSDGGGDAPLIRALEDVTDDSQALALQTFDDEMSLAIATSSDLDTPPVPIEYDMDGDEWSISVRGATPALPAPPAPPAIQDAPRPAEPCATPSTSNQVQLHTQSEDSIPVNESIISLLLKLHSQLSGRLDSFSLDEPAPDTQEPIGDGPYFIGRVLRKLAALDARCAAAIAHVRHTLWPHQRERQAEQRARERREKEERSRRARERQQQLMREFARRQQQFMSAMQTLDGTEAGAMEWEEEEAVERDYDCVICNTTTPTTPSDPMGLVVLLQVCVIQQQFMSAMQTLDGTEAGAMEWEEEEAVERDYDCVICNTTTPTTPSDPMGLVVLLQVCVIQQQFMSAMQTLDGTEAGAMEWEEEEAVERDYDCVICNTTTPTTPSDPMGLVVLLQSTSVLGHRRRAGGGGGRLPLSEADRAGQQQQHDTTAAAHHYRLHDDLHQHFDQESWLVSVSVGWEGGVHVQSCGHHLHLRCLHAYLRALQAPQRPHNLHVERGEFLCPVCRQLANCVLPLAPHPAVPRTPHRAHHVSAQIIHDMLEKEHPPPAPSRLSEAMGKAMEDMTATAGGKLKQRYGSSPAAIFTFVASLVRSNLECELVQRGGTLQTCVAPRYKLRNECIALRHVHVRGVVVRSNLECELVQRGGTLQTCVAPRYKLRNECIALRHVHVRGVVVRSNLECELVQRGGTLQTCVAPRYKLRNECIALRHVHVRGVVVRSNLECELVQRGGTLQTCVAPRYKLRNECIALRHVHVRGVVVRSNLECELVQRGGTLQTCVAPRYKLRNECIALRHVHVRGVVVRSNLECELVQRGGTLQTCVAPRYKLRNECIVPLLVVAGAHSRVLSSAGAGFGARDAWRALVPAPPAEPAAAAASPVPSTQVASRPVPLLLRDPLALLMQFLLLAPPTPPYLDMQEFTCIVRALYALSYYQVVCQFIANASAEGRAALAGAARPGEPAGLRAAAKLMLGALAGSDLFTEDGPPAPGEHKVPDLANMEKELQELLLPFLRIAALLRHHLYGAELPEVATPRQEFVRLAYYLELVTDGMEWSEWSAGRALPPESAVAARAWARQLGGAAARGQLAVRRLLRSMAVEWSQPALLALPRDYDRLFTYYHERVCLQCGAVPKEASVCLLCGTLVCLKQPCCRQHQVAEAVQHAIECGGGTGIFLVVTSTYIIVIRGRRACLWGSLYLDDYDEEDRDLKRGKPLYLSQDRLELLQAQWLSHRFDHTKRTWVWHRDSL